MRMIFLTSRAKFFVEYLRVSDWLQREMCALVKDVTNEPRIYEFVRRIYDIQSSSEDSLGHRQRRRSLIKNSRATRTASLFIDRLRNEFQRGDDFVPRFRSHRNWCPKFPSKYFFEEEDGERSTSLGKSTFQNFIRETPKIYSIGLCEPRMRRRVNDDGERVSVINIDDTVEYFKRCSLLTRRNPKNDIQNDPPREESINWKKRIPSLPSFATLSIPLISSFPIPTDCMTKSSYNRRVASYDRSESPKKNERTHMKSISLPKIQSFEKDHRKISKKRNQSPEYDWKPQWSNSVDDIVYRSINRPNFVEEAVKSNKRARTRKEFISNERSTYFEKQFTPSETTSNDCVKHERVMVNIVNCKTSEEFLRDGCPDQLIEDLFLEEISIGSSTSKYKEFFSPLDTSREIETLSEMPQREREILEDIRKRIDEDFESSSPMLDEDFEVFRFSCNTEFQDKAYSLDSDSFLDLEDDLLMGIEQSKSVPMITSTVTKRRSSKSITLVSSTLVEDDFYDLQSPHVNLSKDTLKEYRNIESNDSRYPSCTDFSSTNSIICQSTYDFPSTYLESMTDSPEKTVATRSIDDRNLDVRSILSRSFSTSDVSMSNEYESASSKNDASYLGFTKEKRNIPTNSKDEYETIVDSSDYERSKTNLTRGLLQSFPLKQRKSSKNLVESIDSGVMMDYSRNDIRACGNTVQKNTNALFIYENQFNAKKFDDLPMFDFDSDSTYSDDSLDRRVDRAVKKCTEDLILLERRMKIRLKTIENQTNESTNDFLTYFDWNSGDERIGSISTPSLVSLTDSDKS